MTQDHALVELYNRFQKIHVLLDDGDRRSLQDIDLTTSQYHLLMHLATKGSGYLNITNLADYLICSRSNATRMVRRLEDQGLVRSVRDTTDRRLVLVSMTEEGERRYQQAAAAHFDSICRRLNRLPEDDVAELRRLADLVTDLLEDELRAEALVT